MGDMTVLLMEDADGTNHPAREVWRNTADTVTWVDYSCFTSRRFATGTLGPTPTCSDGEAWQTLRPDAGHFVGLGYEWELIPDSGRRVCGC